MGRETNFKLAKQKTVFLFTDLLQNIYTFYKSIVAIFLTTIHSRMKDASNRATFFQRLLKNHLSKG